MKAKAETTKFIVKLEAEPAWFALSGLLVQLHHDGHDVVCTAHPDVFTSEDYRVRREAADACAWCPAATACATFADANREPAHVWGGRDRTPPGRGRKPAGGGGA